LTESDPGAQPQHESRGQPPGPPLDCDTPLARGWAVALWAMAGFWLIWLALPAAAEVVQGLDDRVWEAVVSAEQPVLVAVAKFLDAFGGTLSMSIVVVVVALLLAWRRHWPGLVVWLLTVTISQGLNVFIKWLYERARPPLGLVEEHSFSFVSGHSLTAAAIAITLVLVWVPAGHRRRNLLIVAVAYAAVMASSRVYLRAHWLTDTYVGVVIGAGVAVTVALLASWWVARSER
jgi:membrane-associated phospholipid phosphatase